MSLGDAILASLIENSCSGCAANGFDGSVGFF